MSNFKSWLIKEGKDIFGFESDVIIPAKKVNEERPVNTLDIDLITEILSRYNLGELQPFSKFVNEVQWGHTTGAIRLLINQKLKFMVERLGVDLAGNERWYCKKIFQVDRRGEGGKEEIIAQELYDFLKEVHSNKIDSPKSGYKEFEDLVAKISEDVKKVAAPIFIFEGVRKVSDYNYIIRMSLRGQGVEAPQHKRVEENQTQVVYDDEAGIIRLSNYNVVSEVGREHKWSIDPMDHVWYFMPTQNEKEISETIANVMYWY
jgi:hypothetical protein